MIDGYIICFLASFAIPVWCYGSSHGYFGAFIYRNEGKDTDMHQRLSYDLHRFAFISPQLYEWDCVVTYTSRAKRSEPSAHKDQRCFVGFLIYADFAFQCHSRSCCSLVKFIGSHLSLKSSWAERGGLFFLCFVFYVFLQREARAECFEMLSWCLLFIFSCIFPVSIFSPLS